MMTGKVHDYKTFQNGRVVSAWVDGDTGKYEVYIYRADTPKKEMTGWSCECKWDSWARKRETLYLRVCSHALAVMLLMNARSYPRVRRNDPYDYAAPQGATAKKNE